MVLILNIGGYSMKIGRYLKKNFKIWDMDPPVKDFFVEKIDWNSSGLEIILEEYSEDRTKVKLLFENMVYSYTVTEEGYKPSVWISRQQQFYPFYYSYRTKEIERFCKDLEYIRADILHFLIIGIDFVIDVFTNEFPSIEKLDS